MKLNNFEKRWLTQAIAETEITNSKLLEISFETETDYENDKIEELVVEQGIKIAEREGFVKKLDTWITRTKTLGLFIIALIFMVGFASAFNLHENSSTREINALLLILIILIPNIVMMFLWFFGFLIQARRPIGIANFWEWFISHISGEHKQIIASFLKLHDQGNLTRWWLGCITHRFWTFITLGVLTGLTSALAFRGYDFIWETTWLNDATFIIIINKLGIIPSYLGFKIPDNPFYILNSYSISLDNNVITGIDNNTNLENRRAWTFWLLGCIFVYGLIPRLFLWALCSLKYKYSRNRIKLNLISNEYKGIKLSTSSKNEHKKTAENLEKNNTAFIDNLIEHKKQKQTSKTDTNYSKKTNNHEFFNYLDNDNSTQILYYFRVFKEIAEKNNIKFSERIILFMLRIPLWLNIQSKNMKDTNLILRTFAKIALWFFNIKRLDFILFIITIFIIQILPLKIFIYVFWILLVKICIWGFLKNLIPVFRQ